LDKKNPFQRGKNRQKELSWVAVVQGYLAPREEWNLSEVAEFLRLLEVIYASTWMLNDRSRHRFSTAFWDTLCIVAQYPDNHKALMGDLRNRFKKEEEYLVLLATDLQHRQPSDREKVRYFLLRAELTRRMEGEEPTPRLRQFLVDCWNPREFWDRTHVERLLWLHHGSQSQAPPGWTKAQVKEASAKLGCLVMMDVETNAALQIDEKGGQDTSAPLKSAKVGFWTAQDVFKPEFSFADFTARQDQLLNDLRSGYGLNLVEAKAGRKRK